MQRPWLAADGWDPNLHGIRNLVINQPPGTSKSLIVSVLFPAWCWAEVDATLKFIFASYDEKVAFRDANKFRELIDDPEFIEVYGIFASKNEWKKSQLTNRFKGSRLTVTVRGGITGFHADIQCVDDPIKPSAVYGAGESTRVELDAVSDWWRITMPTRLIDQNRSARIIMMQRLHEADLSGEAIASGDYEHLCMPMRFDPKRAYSTKLGKDWRTEEGELLCPKRYPEEAIERLEKALGGAAAVSAQLQQDPAPPEGTLFKEAWMCNFYRALPVGGQAKWLQSWDMRFKDDESKGDYVVGQVWCKIGIFYYLVDQVRGRWSFSETCLQVKALSKKHPKALIKLVENAANGPAIVSSLKKKIPGFVLINAGDSKVGRANAASELFESGAVFLPEDAEFLSDYVFEMTHFPRARHDDQVDATTQALNRLYAPERLTYAERIGAL